MEAINTDSSVDTNSNKSAPNNIEGIREVSNQYNEKIVDDKLLVYQQFINEMASQNSNEVLSNAGKDHAAIVMAKLFEKTNQSVNMVVGKFDGSVSNDSNYLNELEKCIDRKVQFRVLFLDEPNENSFAYELLKSKKSNGFPISFARATTSVKDRFNRKGKEVHYSVFDDDKYRFEKDTKHYLAWVCFNDKNNSKELLEIFNEVFGQAQPI